MITLIIQILVSIVLVAVIVLQSKGTGLGAAFGGTTSYHTKRGMEKSLFATTIILSIAFVVLAMINAL